MSIVADERKKSITFASELNERAAQRRLISVSKRRDNEKINIIYGSKEI